MRSRGRRWAFRLAAVVGAPVLALTVLEGGARALWGDPDYPLPGLEEAASYLYWQMPERVNPLFELEPDTLDGDDGWFRTRSGINHDDFYLVRPQRFPARRTPEAVRVAFLGGSSVQGWPFRRAGASFPDEVGRRLAERFPERRVDVVNGGVGSYNSFQIVDVAYQIQALGADVAVLYAGHNDRGYYVFHNSFLDSIVQARGPSLQGARRLANRLTLFKALRRIRERGSPTPPPRAEVETSHTPDNALLQRESYEDFLGHDRYLEFLQLEGHYLPRLFERNLTDIVTLLQQAGIAVVLVTPAANLRDWEPTLSLHWEPIDAAAAASLEEELGSIEREMRRSGVGPRSTRPVELARADGHWHRQSWALVPDDQLAMGSDAAVEACAPLLQRLEAAHAISPRYARTAWLQGLCRMHSDAERARRLFLQAIEDSPALPPWQRANRALVDVLGRVGAARQVPVVDGAAAIAAAAERGIADGTFFVDNIHLSRRGAEVLGAAIAAEVERLPVWTRPAERPPDPPAREIEAALLREASQKHWGMGLEIQGAGEPYLE